MTADTDRWLALCDEADGQHAKTTMSAGQPWSVWIAAGVTWSTDDTYPGDEVDAAWIAASHEREPMLTKAIRELVAENERLRKSLVLAWPHLEAVFRFAGIHGLTKPVPEIVALAKVVGTISSIVVD